MRILEELWYGRVIPNERPFRRKAECLELAQRISNGTKELKASLTEQEQELYEKLYAWHMELAEITECESFITGFRLAMQIMVEAVQEERSELN